ncbi:hypothetical protein N9X06_00665 [Paracoccaceae bacterium]|nr:hypothetical protein [Paracoccaceae bacterium]
MVDELIEILFCVRVELASIKIRVVPMTEDQILRLWMIVGGGSLILLFIGALTNKVTVYRDYSDVGWSISLIAFPILGFFILAFIAGDDADIWLFAIETTAGNVILGVTSLVIVWSTVRTYLLSIQDNGLILGLLIGTAKVLIAVVIALFAIGLVNYLFRDQRKLGHMAIFFMLFAVFGWFVNILVNGERTGVA